MVYAIADKTLQAIEDRIAADQGGAYRQWLEKVIPHIGDAYRGPEERSFRSHLGASGIGKECPRAIWYSFRWVQEPKFSGRMIRLFNRGHLEEARFIAILLTIGVQVYQQDGNGHQYRISEWGGLFGGSGDGVGIGFPELGNEPALLEFKTHGSKSFVKLVKDGVREAKFEHFVQMQCYMHKMGLAVGVYFAVNKDTDELHIEIIQLDSHIADQYINRAGALIATNVVPDRIKNASPAWFICKFCDYNKLCFKTKDAPPPEHNCRTCKYSEPNMDGHLVGQWSCHNKERQITLLFPATNPLDENYQLTKQRQQVGCEHYEILPSL